MRLEVIMDVFNEVDYLQCWRCGVYAYPERDDSPAPVDESQRWRHMLGGTAMPCKASKAIEERYQQVYGT